MFISLRATWLQVLRGLKANAILTGNMRSSQHQRWKLSGSDPAIASDSAMKGVANSIEHGVMGAGAGALSEQRVHDSATTASVSDFEGHALCASCLPNKELNLDKTKKQPAHHSNAVVSSKLVTPGCTGSAKVSDEERRARKRVKKQRQKQAAQTDPVKKDREKEKRARRKSARKAKPPNKASAGT